MKAEIRVYVRVDGIEDAKDVASDISEILSDAGYSNSVEVSDIYNIDDNE